MSDKTAEKILDAKESYDFLRGAHRVLVRIAMKEHTKQTLQELRDSIKELSNEINNAINSQREEGREIPDWLKGQNHAYVNVLELIDKQLKE